jgi:hypothetical protein
MATRVRTTERKGYQDRDDIILVLAFKINLTIFTILL